MKRKLLAILLVVCLTLSLTGTALASDATGDIVILYTNDVHCGVDDNIGYAGLAAYEAEMKDAYGADRVTLVDAGDAVQGAAIGTLSTGKYLVDIMNEMGYDVFTPGNHEFDYGMARMLELMGMMKAAVVSCNFTDLKTGKTVFEPYTVLDYGDIQIAYVGITTPKTFTASTPKYFQDGNGNYIYGFCEDDTGEALYAAVQDSVDKARTAGADVVVALGHCGTGDEYKPWQSTDIIANTTGIDVFIDGHSHSTIAEETHTDRNGDSVLLTSTGTKLAAIGKLVVTPDGAVSTELITDYTKKDSAMDAYVKSIQAENDAMLKSVVAKSDVALIVADPDTGTRLVRSQETNLGDLCADAYRSLLGADVAVVNGGGVRADIAAGDITYNDIIAVHPFGNTACVVEATGQEILDLLEMGARNTPEESGGFMQVSGMTYEIHTYIKSSVVLDDKGNFTGVNGEYRVKNVKIGGQPLNLDKTYTLASHNYLIKNGGDGYPCFMDNKLLQDEVMIDNQVLITYIKEELGDVVGSAYANLYGQGRISRLESPFTDLPSGEWYTDAAIYVFDKGIMNGTTATAFAPQTAMSRGMFVTMLYRLAGSPAVADSASALFDDCEDGKWYSEAVAWAVKNGITTGASERTFACDTALTRQEMATFLYRYIKSSGGGFTGEWTYLLDFTDRADISDWAYEAVAFCSQNGLITGVPGGAYMPTGAASRAMGAVILQRFDSTQSTEPAA